MAEMELIEQMREKRAFENALPPTSDEVLSYLNHSGMLHAQKKTYGRTGVQRMG
jgi:hypothetical protein